MKRNKDASKEVQDKINNKQKMEKNKKLQNEIHFAISRKPLLNVRGTGVYAKVGKYVKIFSYMVIFIGITVVLNSCMGGYVASEPSYVDYARPQRQYDNQIWIDGDWGWNNQSHVYVQRAGYWESPRQGHSYVKGSWQSSPRGKSWSKGYWQKDAQPKNNRQNNNRQNNDRQNNNSNR